MLLLDNPSLLPLKPTKTSSNNTLVVFSTPLLAELPLITPSSLSDTALAPLLVTIGSSEIPGAPHGVKQATSGLPSLQVAGQVSAVLTRMFTTHSWQTKHELH